MIVERETLMSEEELNNDKWFPNFIVVRRQVDSDHIDGA